MRAADDDGSVDSPCEGQSIEHAVLGTGNANLAIAYHIFRAEQEAKRGKINRSENHAEIAESLLEYTDNLWLRGLLQLHQGCLAYLAGHFVRAHDFALAAYRTAQESGHHNSLCASLTNLGAAYLVLGQPSRAERAVRRALEVSDPETALHSLSLETLAEIWLVVGDLDRCSSLLEEVTLTKQKSAQEFSAWHRGWTTVVHVRLMQARADWSGSLVRLKQELPSLTLACPSVILHRLRLLEAAALIQIGRWSEASTVLSKFENLGGMSSPVLLGQFVALAARLERERGNLPKAERLFRTGLAILSSAGEVSDIVSSIADYAALLRRHSPVDAGSVPSQQWSCWPLWRPTKVRTRIDDPPRLADSSAEESSELLADFVRVRAHQVQHPAMVGELVLRLLAEHQVITKGVLLESVAGKNTVLASYQRAASGDGEAHHVSIQLGRGDSGLHTIRASLAATLTAADVGHALTSLFGRGDLDLTPPSNDCSPPRSAAEQTESPARGVYESASMRALLSTAKRAAATDAPVLISGESGTGKELLARFVHDASPRSSGPFAPFNCSAVPRDIVDSHLFGHRRGSFTGAVDTSVGVIPGAAGGTVFLDELSELPLEVQPKLLRFLDSGEIHALGEARPKVVNVRVVAACNVEPEELVAHGRLRKDLYYRLNVFRLRVPPLRDRRDDVLALIDWFLADTQRRAGRSDVHLAPATRAHLALYEWPGNVRELAAEMYRLVACAENGETIAPAALSREVLLRSDRFQTPRQTATGFLPAVNFSLPLKELLEEVEKAAVEHALAASGGSQTDAAERLGLSRKGLYLKRQRLGI